MGRGRGRLIARACGARLHGALPGRLDTASRHWPGLRWLCAPVGGWRRPPVSPWRRCRGASSSAQEGFAAPTKASTSGPRVMENSATLRRMLKRQFGARSDDPSANDQLKNRPPQKQYCDALRGRIGRRVWVCSLFVARHASSSSCVPLARDSPCSSTDPASALFRAFPSRSAPGRLAVEPYRPLQGRVDWKDSSGGLYRRDA